MDFIKIQFRFVELSISRRQPKYYPLCQNLPFFPTYAAIDPKQPRRGLHCFVTLRNRKLPVNKKVPGQLSYPKAARVQAMLEHSPQHSNL